MLKTIDGKCVLRCILFFIKKCSSERVCLMLDRFNDIEKDNLLNILFLSLAVVLMVVYAEL